MFDGFDPGFDDDSDALFENAARLADYAQWCAPTSTKPNGLRKHSDSEVKRIRRNAFLWSRKNIKIGYSTSDLLNKNVETVHILLHNQAFKYINLVPSKTIGPHSKEKVGSVKAINIGGCTSFHAKDKFPYDAVVTIYYRAKKEIRIPFSSESVRKTNYKELCDKLEAWGFSNITKEPKRNIIAGWAKKEGAIDKVYINGKSSFKEGGIHPFDVEIVVKYDSRIF